MRLQLNEQKVQINTRDNPNIAAFREGLAVFPPSPPLPNTHIYYRYNHNYHYRYAII